MEKVKTAFNSPLRVAELFAGVGGFRLGLEDAGMQTVWANQWEPPGSMARQFAWRCYESHFGAGSCVNEDIEVVLNQYEEGECFIPDFDLLCGGFPCQDYSVAKSSNQAKGIQGRKGVLWWQIERMLALKKPRYLLLENVDRLLKSPANQRGRDFAIILKTLDQLGYSVEWRVINAADYGFPQSRKRVFLFGERTNVPWNLKARIAHDGIMAMAFPAKIQQAPSSTISIRGNLMRISTQFGDGAKTSVFLGAGAMQNGRAATATVAPSYKGPFLSLGDMTVPDDKVPDAFYLEKEKLERWSYLKGAKKEPRVCRRTGHEYMYSEGTMPFPDSIERPARTILTGEGGSSPSRFKHVIKAGDGRLRRLTPMELERLFGFPDGWTDTGMTDVQRAFCMGNALVVGIVRSIGAEIVQYATKPADLPMAV